MLKKLIAVLVLALVPVAFAQTNGQLSKKRGKFCVELATPQERYSCIQIMADILTADVVEAGQYNAFNTGGFVHVGDILYTPVAEVDPRMDFVYRTMEHPLWNINPELFTFQIFDVIVLGGTTKAVGYKPAKVLVVIGPAYQGVHSLELVMKTEGWAFVTEMKNVVTCGRVVCAGS